MKTKKNNFQSNVWHIKKAKWVVFNQTFEDKMDSFQSTLMKKSAPTSSPSTFPRFWPRDWKKRFLTNWQNRIPSQICEEEPTQIYNVLGCSQKIFWWTLISQLLIHHYHAINCHSFCKVSPVAEWRKGTCPWLHSRRWHRLMPARDLPPVRQAEFSDISRYFPSVFFADICYF